MATQNGKPAPDHDMPSLVADVPPCFACKELSTRKCADCGDARYCSEKCQKKDWPMHKHLCKAFTEMESRPSPEHYRDLLFPLSIGASARFVWSKHEGNEVGISTHMKSSHRAITKIERFHKLDRKLNHAIYVVHWTKAVEDGCPRNVILAQMLGVEPRPRTCGFLVHDSSNNSQTDLDTSALGPLLDHYRYSVRRRLVTFDAVGRENDTE